MNAPELLRLIERGEDSRHQFKETIKETRKLADEMVAFSNSQGGMIVIGVNDQGEVKGLSKPDMGQTNQHIANAATNNVRPAINVITENIEIEKRKMIVVHVNEGINKPYCNNEGAFWVKNGSDKRKVTSPEELQRLFQSSGKIYVDESIVEGTSKDDLNLDKFNDYFQKVYKRDYKEIDHSIDTLLEKLNLAKNGPLNLAGLLLFGNHPSRYRPAFIIKAISFFGNDTADRNYRDSEDMEGVLARQYHDAMAFLLRNLKKTQQGQHFNSLGILEVSQVALEEVLQNAIIHRDYLKNAPIRIFIFDNRIEIISPGKLPNSLTVENIKFGNSTMRNALIASFATKILPYRGLGLGILNALKEQPNIEFYNDVSGEQFKVTIPRPEEKKLTNKPKVTGAKP
ncbi:MAG: ATP-dependent DNA helicase RecG [bacterium]|nr:ATP-dependent DNA helicase RecG [bacterium]